MRDKDFALWFKSRDYERDAIRKTQAVIEFDPSGIIIDANKLFLDTMGYSLAEVKGQHHQIFVDHADRETADYKAFWQKLASGSAMQDQFLRVAKDGSRLWLQATYTPIIDRAGKVVRVVKFATDITARKNELADLQGQIAAINKSQAVIAFDLSGKVLDANANFLSVMGFTLDEIRGKHHSLFVDEAERSSPDYRKFWEKLGRGDYVEGQFRRIAKGGREVWLQASYNPILDALGKPWKVIKYASDVTAAKAEGDLRGAVAQTRAVVEAAMNRDLTKRIATEGLGGDVLALCEGVNDLLASYADVVSSVSSTTADVNDTVHEIASASDNLSKRTEDQAASLEETAATTEQLAASVKATSQASQRAASIADEAMRTAESGGTIVGQAVEAMSRIESSSARISDISRVIDDIAFQTNLLALNAAVEAARAGEAGKGFAVVASEVRTLAQRSGAAAKDIFMLISSSNDEVSQGVKLVRQAGEALTEILASSRKVAGTIADISTAAGEQAHGIDEVSQTVANLDSITQANAALAEESASSASTLSSKAEALYALISAFQIEGTKRTSLRIASTNTVSAARPIAQSVVRTGTVSAAIGNLDSLALTAFNQSKVASPALRKVVNGLDQGWEEF